MSKVRYQIASDRDVDMKHWALLGHSLYYFSSLDFLKLNTPKLFLHKLCI